MRLLLKKHFYRPLKMLYRYKSKWYMPPKIKTKFGLSKAKLLQKDFKKIYKKNRARLLAKLEKPKQEVKELAVSIRANALPLLLNQKQSFPHQKKYIRTKFTKTKLELKKKKHVIKAYLKKVLNEASEINTKATKITSLVLCANIINKFVTKTRAIASLSNIKNLIKKKNETKFILKKRLINSFTLTSKYFSNYSALQNNILITAALLKKKKNLKKVFIMLNYVKVKQALIAFKLREKECYVYNDEILDSNFLENNLREIWGKNPAKNLSDYFLSKEKRIKQYPGFKSVSQRNVKKLLQFRLKRKGKFKKNYDKMYYKKRRINFEERSYNRTGLNELKRKELKMKRHPLSLLHLNVKKAGILFDVEPLKTNLISNFKLNLKKRTKKLLFLNPASLLEKLQQIALLKSKTLLRPFIKKKFMQFVRLLKLELKKNSKKIKKYTKKIMFYKKQKGLFYRKKKIETLNIREYFIRENQKLREEIKLYRYNWRNSPFFNFNQVKQDKLNLIIGLRKQKNNFFNLMKKYPEGMAAIKARIKSNQYYTGLSLLKRKLEQSFGSLDLSVLIRAFTLSYNTSIIFGQQQVKWVFSGPKRSYAICNTKL